MRYASCVRISRDDLRAPSAHPDERDGRDEVRREHHREGEGRVAEEGRHRIARALGDGLTTRFGPFPM